MVLIECPVCGKAKMRPLGSRYCGKECQKNGFRMLKRRQKAIGDSQ
jgi:predicted nucleic acid-binding Zn ribbon protein